MPAYVYLILILGWFAWFLPFVTRKRARHATTINKQARWGILLEAVAFALHFQGRFWACRPSWQLLPAILLFVIAAVLSWSGVVALGRQWRLDAGLSPDHQLIRSGAYSVVRHPIYASMLCVLLSTGLILTPWFLFIPSMVLFLIGTEIRVRVEDTLLAANFGQDFLTYQHRISAYIPYVR